MNLKLRKGLRVEKFIFFKLQTEGLKVIKPGVKIQPQPHDFMT